MSEPVDSVTRRVGARALMMTPDDRVLLMNLVEPSKSIRFWITPGGGLEAGESEIDGPLRELSEEVGRSDFDVGPAIWKRTSRFDWDGQAYEQRETYYLVATEAFDPGDGEEMEIKEREAFRSFRWWPVDEIQGSEEVFAPRDLGGLLQRLATEGPPPHPLETGY